MRRSSPSGCLWRWSERQVHRPPRPDLIPGRRRCQRSVYRHNLLTVLVVVRALLSQSACPAFEASQKAAGVPPRERTLQANGGDLPVPLATKIADAITAPATRQEAARRPKNRRRRSDRSALLFRSYTPRCEISCTTRLQLLRLRTDLHRHFAERLQQFVRFTIVRFSSWQVIFHSPRHDFVGNWLSAIKGVDLLPHFCEGTLLALKCRLRG
jgi:hypothetical protein